MFLSLRYGEIRIQVLWRRTSSSKTSFSEEKEEEVDNYIRDILIARIFLQKPQEKLIHNTSRLRQAKTRPGEGH